MKPTRQLHDLGQSLWLDNITRGLLTDGTLQRYISEFSLTGLTSNPTIFDKAITEADSYDAAIRQLTAEGKSGEALFFELAIEDLTRAADLFRPVHDGTGGVDGWVSLEVSPLLAHNTAGTIDAAGRLHQAAQRPNLFIKIPGTAEGIPAIEASIFAGVPVNVTLLFSREQYVDAAHAYLRGIEGGGRAAVEQIPRLSEERDRLIGHPFRRVAATTGSGACFARQPTTWRHCACPFAAQAIVSSCRPPVCRGSWRYSDATV